MTSRICSATAAAVLALSFASGGSHAILNHNNDANVEPLLSPAELKWYRYGTDVDNSNDKTPISGKEGNDRHVLVCLDLEQTKNRIKTLEAELTSIQDNCIGNRKKMDDKSGHDDDEEEVVVDDNNISADPKYALSDAERKWMGGEDPVIREAKILEDLRDLKERLIRLRKDVEDGNREGWKSRNSPTE
mmetsp:Transcript_6023/g.13112  ORF Transcript_6023/g.13112 Transcript_6023/m.13112 type:complete len:189 (+) Transcript_6023:248-814(+)|eukprot:CAMPEP_0178515650 /NCGR_PEP_ID=MMETSP0696-20121128/24670_1 /TAXON_ID=265572 /ORGANISM="Extubocellulus spinifer, Strain CCMP396" /LENGTH=188 /DNA_ID=CAMNT_0020145827 /DNA_START=211 /DNA_END=777 /DNA_ORIENTATION=+